ncbi:uncharacterized protein LOC120623263 [Pararge aegeria]|uniref:Jg13052 protein n=1 Tax=Pararge aegeria aegeria TaxID=348720 RepID=A0A8S4SBG1_9NEOP|nr:uncharacterized protein LOC120623263 [Pararge aegeria]CAH2257653.1 jg13052 [Pararge aegeria aegeria]
MLDIVTGEVKGNDKEGNNENDEIKEHQRRFLEALDDRDWHVSHLKDMDFDTDCEKATFHDKVKKYRRTLRSDGALVEFVSADALPYNETDLPTPTCKSNLTRRLKNVKKNQPEVNVTNAKYKEISANASDDIKPATVSVKEKKKPEDTVPNKNYQRRSEYQFSSVEYYDEVQDFNADVCPDAVEVIELELDTLRSYDIVCEATLEWRSLE